MLQDLRYTYDAAGNVVIYADEAQQDVFFSNTVASPTHTYQYDNLARLVHATGREHARDTHYSAWFGPGAQGDIPYDTDGKLRPYTQSYACDDAGNLLGLSHVVPSDTGANYSRAYTYAATSHRMATAQLEHDVTPQAITHDSRGRITSMSGLETLTWDDADRLRFSQSSSGASQRVFYVYDAAGTRIRKAVEQYIGGAWVHTQDLLYLGGFERKRTYSGTTLWTERETLHAHDGDRRLALVETKTVDDGDPVTTPTPLLRYQLDNHLRSATVETSATGAVISYEEFHPYGTTAYHAADNSLDDIPKRYRYSGKEKDPETGLYYYGARYLAPWLGRWVSTDPAGFVDGPNVYAFVKGRPSMGWDGDGRWLRTFVTRMEAAAANAGFRESAEGQFSAGSTRAVANPPRAAGSSAGRESSDQSPTLTQGMTLRGARDAFGSQGAASVPDAILNATATFEQFSDWADTVLEQHVGQLRVSAEYHSVPTEMLVGVILGEAADLNVVDWIQDWTPIGNLYNRHIKPTSHGIASIRVPTALAAGLLAPLVDSPPPTTAPTSSELSYARSALLIPNVAIDATARRLAGLVSSARHHADDAWQSEHMTTDFRVTAILPVTLTADDIRRGFARNGSESSTTRMIRWAAAAFNSERIIESSSPHDFNNAIAQSARAATWADYSARWTRLRVGMNE